MPNIAQQTDAAALIAIEDRWGAHNYHHRDMVIERGRAAVEGAPGCEL